MYIDLVDPVKLLAFFIPRVAMVVSNPFYPSAAVIALLLSDINDLLSLLDGVGSSI